MSSTQVGAILRHIHQLSTIHRDSDVPDRQLLERFATLRDEAAFALLLKRHGPMVLGVCRSVLHDWHDAEDAFQAAFLILARKGGSIHRREAVSAWLYRVAYHLAVKAQASAARRRVHERKAVPMPPADPVLDISLRELRGILNEELQRLPEQYRAPMVLCCLEEKSLEEAARLLGWTKGAVKGRLQRGRERLRQRLRRRGLELSAGLIAAALSTSSASAQVSALLTASTLRAALQIAAGDKFAASAVSAQVAALVQGAMPTMFLSKIKIVTILFLALSFTTIGGIALHQASAVGPTDARSNEAPKSKPPVDRPSAPKPEADQPLEVNGQVVDPDGKPFAGAKLYLRFFATKSSRLPARATSGPEGRFRFTFSKAERGPEASEMPYGAYVMAVAAGYGSGWSVIPEGKNALTLRLVKEGVLRGRILDQDGKPVSGAHIHVQQIIRYPAPALTQYLNYVRKGGVGEVDHKGIEGWPGSPADQSDTLTTGPDGRFRLTGLGTTDLVTFRLDGPGIHYLDGLKAMTRPSEPVIWPGHPLKFRVYGATFDHLAESARAVRGTVRDKETGQPIADVRIHSWQTTHQTRTDKHGRFELLGCPKGKSYTLEVSPSEDLPYFAASVRLDDTPGLDPLNTDIALRRGLLCRGRLTDRQTGKPIEGAKVEYNPLFPNLHINKLGKNVANPCSSTTTGKDGSYRLAVLPGPGALGIAISRLEDHYMPASVDQKELAALWNDNQFHGDDHGLFTAAGPNSRGIMGVNQYHALAFLNPGEKDEAVTRNVTVQPCRERHGRVLGPDGRPTKGVQVYGLHNSATHGETLAGDTFTVRRLNPNGTRILLFYDKGKQLGCYKEVHGEESTPLVVRLEPCGSATGRLVDGDGQPIAGADIGFFRDRIIGPGGVHVRTDKDGQFRADGLVPGQTYDVRPARDPQLYRPYFKSFAVKPGEVKNLGEAKAERNN